MSDQSLQTRPGKLQANSQVDYILVDGSGSMRPKWWDTLDAIEAYVQGTKAGNMNSQIIMHVFDDTDLEQIARDVPIAHWKPLRDDPVGAHFSGTPLYDAIALMGRRMRDLDPPRASIVVVTDGEESDSKHTNLTQAKAILDWCRAKGWQVTFIGANFSNAEQSAALGIDRNAAIGVQQKRLVDAATALAKKRTRYGLYGTPMSFSEEEQQDFGGYLAPPKP